MLWPPNPGSLISIAQDHVCFVCFVPLIEQTADPRLARCLTQTPKSRQREAERTASRNEGRCAIIMLAMRVEDLYNVRIVSAGFGPRND